VSARAKRKTAKPRKSRAKTKTGSKGPARRRGKTTPSGVFPDFEKVARAAVEAATKAGATAADAYVGAGRKTSVKVRFGEIEELTQAGSKGMGIRVLVEGGRQALLYTSDFRLPALRKLAKRAVTLARHSGEDSHAGIPKAAPARKAVDPASLALFDPALLSEPLDAKVARARECEAAAEAVSPEIKNTQGTGYADHLGTVAYRAGKKKLEWDAKNLKATNCPEADQFIQREYRKGWALGLSYSYRF